MERIVIALGGKSLQAKGSAPTAEGQLNVIKKTCEDIAAISCSGYEVAIVHGNGPQVGSILLATETAADVTPAMPFDVCGAMSQGYIGYHIQQALKYALSARNISKPVLTVATQVIVEKDDPAFQNPIKPIGVYYTEEEAKALEEKWGYIMKEQPNGKGWRRLVASPLPRKIVEIKAIKELWKSAIVISCGGGAALREENVVEMKKNGRVVLLTASPETIYERVKDSTERPILNGHMNVEYIAELMEQRREKYEAAADACVAVDGKSVDEICEEIIKML